MVQMTKDSVVYVFVVDRAKERFHNCLLPTENEAKSSGELESEANTMDESSMLADSMMPQASQHQYSNSVLDDDIDYNDLDSISEAVHDESDYEQSDARSVVSELKPEGYESERDDSEHERDDSEHEQEGEEHERDDSEHEQEGEEHTDDHTDDHTENEEAQDVERTEAKKKVRFYMPHRSRSPPRNAHPQLPLDQAQSPPPLEQEHAQLPLDQTHAQLPQRFAPNSVLRVTSGKKASSGLLAVPKGAKVIDITGKTGDEVNELLGENMKKDQVVSTLPCIDLPTNLLGLEEKTAPTQPGLLDMLGKEYTMPVIENQPVSSTLDLFAGLKGIDPAVPPQNPQEPSIVHVQHHSFTPILPKDGVLALPKPQLAFPTAMSKKPAVSRVVAPGKENPKPKKPESVVVKSAAVKNVAVQSTKVANVAVKNAKPKTKPEKKPKAAKTLPQLPFVPLKTIHSDELKPVASPSVKYTPLSEVPAMKTSEERELFGLVATGAWGHE